MFNPTAESMPVEKLRALQLERLRACARRVYERVPFYRQRFEERGMTPDDLRTLPDLARLPFTRKSDLRDHYPFGLLAVPREDVVRIHASSGTTGKPTVVCYTEADVALFTEVVARSLYAAGGRRGMIFHNAYGYGLFTGGLGTHYGGERLGMSVVPISGGMTERQVTLIEDFRPEIIACTPSYALVLAEALYARGHSPKTIPIRYAVLGAEPWTEAMRAQIEEMLGCKATNIYGLSEIIGPGVSQEDANEQNGSYIWEDHFYPEIVDVETGEPLPDGEWGVLVLTSMTREAMPLLRYWTGDITRLIPGENATGRSMRRMDIIRGRADDMLIVRGVNVYPTQLEAVLVTFPQLSAHYQITLARAGLLDDVTVAVEVSEGYFKTVGPELLEEGTPPAGSAVDGLSRQVQHRIKDTVGVTVAVRLVAPGRLPRSQGGKLRRVVDERPAR
ncbi:phenylacetate-CoA ligase [Deinobacterium chartae]|uniref:Phenylacetate-coenzyme A ligase n=1 Tax=Deinobacterium chartae TaxID=521158 RepID=A0A841I2C4_9DEIO|nr:phenylacetate--CoA ligase PaaK [Deinobacterium chartae]MBB6098202.1 phenylacetate-CoA ligase [Deinobacterium chartae]